MKKKNMNAYTFKITQEIENQTLHLKGDKLRNFLLSIKALPLKISENASSRYSHVNTDEERSLVFYEEIEGANFINTEYIPAFFIKRRGKTRPYEEDGEGNLTELTLKEEGHQIAEIGFILFCINTGIAFWIFNPFVGGINKLSEYLNNMFLRSEYLNYNQTDFKQYGQKSLLNFNYIIYPDSLKDFNNNFFDISKLEFNISSTQEELKNAFLFSKSDGEGMNLLRHFFEKSNCSKLSFAISTRKMKKKKNSDDFNNKGLKKEFLLNFYDETLPYLKEKKDSKFTVKGKTRLDSETKVLDLINSKLIYQVNLNYEGATLPLHQIVEKLILLAREKADRIETFI